MKTVKRIIVCSMALVVLGGCAYRHYLGMHGPSVRNTPDVHEGVVEDAECLGCHYPEPNSTGPPTSHPDFSGCLKCHNDPLK